MSQNASRSSLSAAATAVAPAPAAVNVASQPHPIKVQPGTTHTPPIPAKNRDYYRDQIKIRWNQAFQSVMSVAHLLVEAKAHLSEQEWREFTQQDCPFEYSVIQKFLKIAKSPRLNDSSNETLLPNSWNSLHELALMTDETFKIGIERNIVSPKVTVKQLKALRQELELPKRAGRNPVSRDEGNHENVVASLMSADSTRVLQAAVFNEDRQNIVAIIVGGHTARREARDIVEFRRRVQRLSAQCAFISGVRVIVEEGR